MVICKKCKDKERGMLAGQGFRTFTCQLCGQEDEWPNTNVPKFCHECSVKLDMCQRCGGSLNEEKNIKS